jgi:hypothetical protein
MIADAITAEAPVRRRAHVSFSLIVAILSVNAPAICEERDYWGLYS